MLYYIVKTLLSLWGREKEGLCKGGKVGQKDEEKEKGRRKRKEKGRVKGQKDLLKYMISHKF